MSLTPEMMTAMLAAGLSAEQIVAVVNANLAAEKVALEAKAEKRRSDTAERVRKHREAKRNASNALQGVTDITGVTSSTAPLDAPPLPPAPPSPPLNPPTTSVSEPIGSAAVAATEIDPRRDLFSRGKATLRRMSGRANEGCGSLIGKWLKVVDDDAVTVMALIDEADAKELANPVAWIDQAIRSEAQRNGSGTANLFAGRSSGNRPSGTVHSAVTAGLARVADRRGIGPGSRSDDRRPSDETDHRPRRDDPSFEDADWSPAPGHRAACR